MSLTIVNVSMTENVTIVSPKDLYPGCENEQWFISGLLSPILAAIVIFTDLFLIILFCKPRMRSKTTLLLSLIAACDIMSIVPPSVVNIFYYQSFGYTGPVSFASCFWVITFADIVADTFKGMSLWLTTLLTCMRHQCLQTPFEANCSHGYKQIFAYLTFIVLIVLIVHIPSFFIFKIEPVDVQIDGSNITVRDACGLKDSDSIISRNVHIWMQTLLDSFVPALLLLCATISILRLLKRHQQTRLSLRSNTSDRGAQHLGNKSDHNCKPKLKDIQNCRQSSTDSAFEKLDRESRRSSWLIFTVAMLISTHELPLAIIHIYKLVKYRRGHLPLVFLGCWTSLFTLWQSTIYPVALVIFAFMSAKCRKEMWRVVKCFKSPQDTHSQITRTLPYKTAMPSPCTVRKSFKQRSQMPC